tara:strand:- start:7887 stop:8996 length:1110 start_codon:yes stop_codon:yes gene_type:complete
MIESISVNLVDRIEVPTKREFTDAGQMIVPCAFARTGSQQYSAGSLGLIGKDASEMITVFRDEADVFDSKSMSSFRSAPVTIGHPRFADGSPKNVTSENAQELQVGTLEGTPVRDEDTLTGTLVIARQDAIDMIDGGTVELSAGYTCDLIVNDEGEIYQRNIRANHIAIVDKGRAGSSCRIADEEEMDKVNLEDKVEELVEAEAVVADVEEVKEEVVVVDELEVSKLAVATLTDELAVAQSAAAKMEAERDASVAQVTKLQDELDASVGALVDVIVIAKDLTDMKDFSGKTSSEIKMAVVVDKMPEMDLESKSDAYVEAMFDIIVDAEGAETPMSKLLKKEATAVVVDSKPVDLVKEARQKMIARQTRK